MMPAPGEPDLLPGVRPEVVPTLGEAPFAAGTEAAGNDASELWAMSLGMKPAVAQGVPAPNAQASVPVSAWPVPGQAGGAPADASSVPQALDASRGVSAGVAPAPQAQDASMAETVEHLWAQAFGAETVPSTGLDTTRALSVPSKASVDLGEATASDFGEALASDSEGARALDGAWQVALSKLDGGIGDGAQTFAAKVDEAWSEAFGMKPVQSQGPTGEAPCGDKERAVIGDVIKLSAKIHGRASKLPGVVQEAGAPPTSCRFAVTPLQLQHCYFDWGFSKEVAGCWAMERIGSHMQCGLLCQSHEKKGRFNTTCAGCIGRLRQQRRGCELTQMKITEKCSACHMKAYEFLDRDCVERCVDAVDMSDPGGAAERPSCGACMDKAHDMLRACGSL